MKKLVIATLFLILGLGLPAFAAGLFAGYAKMPWGTDAHKIVNAFPKGEMGRLGSQDIYKQKNPNKELKQRSFAFKDGKLTAVSVTFNPAYVKKAGIEKLLASHKKSYGEGAIDRSNAPHMVSYRWEDAQTRITFAYAPQRLDMTVLMFEKK
jgi:hypothetical protein